MIGVTLIGVSYSGNEGVVTETFRSRNRFSLCPVIIIRDPRTVRVFQNVVRDRASFGTALRFGFNINVCHNELPLC